VIATGRRSLLAGASALAGGALVAPLLRARDARGLDHGALDPPVPPVGSVHAVERPDGARLHAVVCGSGHGAGAPTFVLTHGLACDHRLWAYQARLLASLGRVVVWDLRGHGASTTGHGALARALRPEVHAADLRAVVAELATGPVFLVGHSLGGVATLLALRSDPGLRARVAGAALIATPTTEPARAAASGGPVSAVEAASVRLLFRWMVGDPALQRLFLEGRGGAHGYAVLRTGGFGARPSPAHVAALREQIAATPPAVRRATLAGMEGMDLRGTLGAVDVPTLVFAGGRDRLVNAHQAVALAQELPRARSVVFASAGHAVVLERHAAITRRIALLAEEALAGSADLDRAASAAT
jgi:pimeloyl-ACP methyl ester carboxylesterase